jgi:hypothetical protein
MTLLDNMNVQSNGQTRRIELHQGDLTDLSAGDAVDLLVLSAFPDDYAPTQTSLIGALDDKGLSVYDLAQRKSVDLRQAFSCWISNQFEPPNPGIQFDRILCFEPRVRGGAQDFVGDIFRALAPFIGTQPPIRTVAMPIVAAGNQGYSISTMLPPLVEAAVHWMAIGVPLETLKIFTRSDSSALEAKKLFAQLKHKHAFPETGVTQYEYDVFISYARLNADVAKTIKGHLEERNLRLFIDAQSLERGAAWQAHIFSALDSCARMIAVYSPAYVGSKVCQEEFNIAWARSRKNDLNVIYPIYWESADLPTYMDMLNYVDCRKSQKTGLYEACTSLAGQIVDGHRE